MSDDELKRQLPQLHVFGRVSPEDKLRLARVMQSQGLIVAMTGDAVNDAAALKQADIGVAMGSGSEVTKQAARMILTDDNFGTLVHAVELGRRVYAKIVSYVRFQMTQLLSLVMLFIAATAFNINQGVALTPTMVLYLLFFATAAGVVVITVDPGDPDVMNRPPRDPKIPITNRSAILFWILYGAVLFLAALVPLVAGPDTPSVDQRQRIDDDDVRGHGPRHRVQRADQPPRPHQRADRADPAGAGHLTGPGRVDRPGDPAARSAGRLADHLVDRPAMAGVCRAGAGAAAGDRSRQVDPPSAGAGGSGGRCATRGRSPSGRRRRHPVSTAAFPRTLELPRRRSRRADPPPEEPDRRPPQDLEALGHGPEVLRALVRLRTRQR